MAIEAVIPWGWKALQSDIDSGAADSLTGGNILIVDASGQATGKVYEAGPTGQSPSEVATSSTVASAVAKILVKDWAASTAIDIDEVRRAPIAAGTIEAGDLIRSNSARTTGATFDGTEAGNWTEISPDLVTSVAGKTGTVTLVKGDVGLGNVDNTADTAKPVSTAQQTALDAKSATTHAHTGTYEPANTNIQTHVTAAHAPSTAEQNVNADWSAVSGDAQILNKPTIPTVMTGATPIAAGASGLVPTPAAGDDDNFLRGDGTYQTLTSVAAASTVTTDISNQNLNNVTITGFLGGAGLTNTPIVSADWWFVINMTHFGSANWQLQFARRFSPGSPTLYTRLKDNGVWGAWVAIATV